MNKTGAVSANTKICAVIGKPIGHSLSPAIHNAAYEALGLDFVYVACEVSDLKAAVEGLRALGNFRGFSVTIPHKIEAMQYVDDIDPLDRFVGAINTIVCEEERLIGLGTDGPGALKALSEAGVALDGKHILMLGAGGASRSIAFPLARGTNIAALSILDINGDLLRDLRDDLVAGTDIPVHSAAFTDKSLADAMGSADVVIHCTSVGMHPNDGASLVPAELFRPGQVVFDVVYTPLKTKLLTDAEACGLKTVSGVEMFINQAVLQFERFTGVEAPVDVMRKVVMEHLTK